MVFGGGPRGPREAPKRPRRCIFAAMPPRGPQEASKRPPRARICEWSLRFPRFWSGQFLAYFTVVSAPSAPRRVSPAPKIFIFIYVLRWFLHMDLSSSSAVSQRRHFCASSWLFSPFSAFSKMMKTLGPFVKQVLRPPAGTLRGPTCSLYCVLQ